LASSTASISTGNSSIPLGPPRPTLLPGPSKWLGSWTPTWIASHRSVLFYGLRSVA
jgi:hypothetical protein